jgi:hypothetical protein
MKKQVLLMLLVIALSGCATAPPGYYEQLTKAVNLSIDSNQEATALVIEAVEKAEAIPEAKLDSIAEAVTLATDAIDLIQVAALESAKAYDAKAQTGDKVGGVLRAAEIVASIFSPEVALLIAAGGVGYGKYKQSKLAVIGPKYKAIKQGVDAVKLQDPKVASDLYDEIGKARARNGVT